MCVLLSRFLLVVALIFGAQQAFSQGPSMLLLGAGKRSSVGAAYTGPGDVVAFDHWYGLRAYSSATRGTKSVNICNVADVVCTDLNSDASTGLLVVTTIGGSNCSVVTCTCKTWYDKVGTADVTEATIANRPVFSVTGGPNSNATCTFLTASNQALQGTITSINQPVSMHGVVNRTGATTSFNTWCSTTLYEMLFTNSVNTAGVYAGGTVVSRAANDNTWHSIQGLFNGASSSVVVDGSTTTGSAGTGASNTGMFIGSHGVSGSPLTGSIQECGIITGDKTSNFSALNSNAHSVWGF